MRKKDLRVKRPTGDTTGFEYGAEEGPEVEGRGDGVERDVQRL